jgi:long-chain acyl-CoA synthetase
MINYPWLKSYPAGVRWDADIPIHPLFVLLDVAEDKYAHSVAIDFMGRTTTYAELATSVRKLANGLRAAGVNKGVKVGLFMPNCPQFVMSYYAILKAGGTVVNYNPLYSQHELEHQIEDSATEIMITLALKVIYPKVAACLGHTKLRKIIVSEFQEALPLAKRLAFPIARKADITEIPNDASHIRFADLLNASDKPVPLTVHPHDDTAVLQYTGGTTGVPKGAVLTHANLYANAVQCGMWFTGLKDGKEIIVGALPLFHVFAMATVMNLAVHTGSTMLLHPKFDMKNILYDIHFKRPTLMPGVPTMFAAINHYKNIEKYDLTSLKMCICGGGPLPVEVKAAFEKRTGCKLIEGYGLTESSPVASANPLFGVNKAGSIGLPFPGTVMEIVDLENPEKVLGIGETGEICISGPQVMRGYLHQLEETRKVLKNGRLHTGDIGLQDSEGYFFVVDRLKEMIISGGYKVYPRNLEELLYQHPDVLEAAVIGIPHPQRVQAPKVFIVKKEGTQVTESAIREYLRDKVAGYAMPHQVEFREALPKSAIGKILKKELVAEEKAKTETKT